MNTNIDKLSGLPDADALQKLANELFSAVPGNPSGHDFTPTQALASAPPLPVSQEAIGAAISHATANHAGEQLQGFNPLAKTIPAGGMSPISGMSPAAMQSAKSFNVNDFQNGFTHEPFLSSPQSVKSFDGKGINPSSFPETKGFDSGEKQNSFIDSDFAGTGQVPSSAGGSGVSPSALNQGNEVNINNPQTSLLDPHAAPGTIPQSAAGSGMTPSATPQGKGISLSDSQANVPASEFAGSGKAPNSAAGSGVTPSAVHQNNAVDVNNPQTSLRDPRAANPSELPASNPVNTTPSTGIGNNGYSSYLEQLNNPPGLFQLGNSPATPHSVSPLPFAEEQPFQNDLNDALAAINFSFPSAQLPFGAGSGITEGSFYFLSGEKYLPFVKEPSSQNAKSNASKGGVRAPFDVNLIKKDFPILQENINGRPLIWLDNAATTQKPKLVIERLSYFYEHENSNIHRAAHELAARATDAYENARKKVQVFLNASSPNEIVFVRGTTEAINLVAQSWGDQNLKANDEIIITHLEHHANIVPWQRLAAKKGLRLKVVPVDDTGQVLLDEYAKLLGPKTKLVSFTQVSNALGTITPAKQMVEMAHAYGAKVLVDGAQSVSHMRSDVRALDADWFVFSGHKIFGPTGIGVLYGKEELLNETQPWQGGGNMIKDVTFEHTTYHNAPSRFEAGTGNIADAVGLGAALDYVSRLGIDLINQYEHYLLQYGTSRLKEISGIRLIGTAHDKASVMSFVLNGFKTEDVGAALNQYGIAVRSGHHCAQPILRRFGVEGTVRPSLAFYNTCSDIDVLVDALHQITSGRSNAIKK